MAESVMLGSWAAIAAGPADIRGPDPEKNVAATCPVPGVRLLRECDKNSALTADSAISGLICDDDARIAASLSLRSARFDMADAQWSDRYLGR